MLDYFLKKIMHLNQMGIKDIIIDPGFGFGKTIDHNYEILRNLDHFKFLSLPIMIGVSRKSMIYKALNINQSEALNGTTVLHTLAAQKGVNIFRVHDVKQVKEVIKITKQYFGTV